MRARSRKSRTETARAAAPSPAAKAAPGRGPSGEARGRDDPVFLGSGRPLDATTRAHFEPRFGRSLADVRLFGTGEPNAFARGSSIALPSGAETEGGQDRSLLAHELAHVVQQAGATAAEPSPAERATAEDSADRAATRLMAGQRAGPVGRAPQATYFAPPRRFPAEIPAGRRAIIQWGDDDATVANVDALKTGARSGPNAAGADTVIHYRDLKPGMLKDFREVVVVIHGETEIGADGRRVMDPSSGAESWQQQPRATHGAPGLPHFDEGEGGQTTRARGIGPMEAVAPEGMAKTLTGAGFGQGRWKTYRLRLAMCFAGVGKEESYSSRVGSALASQGVEAETHGLTGAVNATGKNFGAPLRFGTTTGTPVQKNYANPEGSENGPASLPSRGKPVADNYYSGGARNTAVGVPGTRVRIDRNAPAKPPAVLEPPEATKPPVRPQVAGALEEGDAAAPKGGARPPVGGARGLARAVGGGVALGAASLALGYLDAYVRSKLDSSEIAKALAERSAEIETLINSRAAEIEKLAADSTADKVYVQLEITLLRGRSFLPGGNVSESVASVGQIRAIGTSVTPIEQEERVRMGANPLDHAFTKESTFVTSVPVRDLAQERRDVADRKLAEAAEKLRALPPPKPAQPTKPSAAAPAPAPVAPAAPVGPQLAPDLQPPAPQISLLPGAPQRMPTPQERMAGAIALGRDILARGNKVLRDSSATKEDRAPVVQEIKRWLLLVQYKKASDERAGMTGALAQQLLDDPAMPGPDLKQLLTWLE